MGIIRTITDSGCRTEFRLSKRQNLREPYQVFERYVALAREAAANGDRIASENFFQHAEHYFRIMSANGEANQHGTQRPMTPADADVSEPDGESSENDGLLQPLLPILPSDDRSPRF